MMRCRLSGETEYLLSAGGNDDCVMVWKHVLDAAEASALPGFEANVTE